MNAVDTNVLLYYFDPTEPVKQAKAVALLQSFRTASPSTILLWQALGEFVSQLRRWQKQERITGGDVRNHVSAACGSFPLVVPSPKVLDVALDIYDRYSLSHWDSMILGACKEAGVTTLYTEDMGAPTVYDGIQLINPFV